MGPPIPGRGVLKIDAQTQAQVFSKAGIEIYWKGMPLPILNDHGFQCHGSSLNIVYFSYKIQV